MNNIKLNIDQNNLLEQFNNFLIGQKKMDKLR